MRVCCRRVPTIPFRLFLVGKICHRLADSPESDSVDGKYWPAQHNLKPNPVKEPDAIPRRY